MHKKWGVELSITCKAAFLKTHVERVTQRHTRPTNRTFLSRPKHPKATYRNLEQTRRLGRSIVRSNVVRLVRRGNMGIGHHKDHCLGDRKPHPGKAQGRNTKSVNICTEKPPHWWLKQRHTQKKEGKRCLGHFNWLSTSSCEWFVETKRGPFTCKDKGEGSCKT